MDHSLKGLRAMATTASAPARCEKTADSSLLAKYRAMRSSLNRSAFGDPDALKNEAREVSESLREERALANSLLLKRK